MSRSDEVNKMTENVYKVQMSDVLSDDLHESLNY